MTKIEFQDVLVKLRDEFLYYTGLDSAKRINDGLCEYFAESVTQEVPDAQMCHSEDEEGWEATDHWFVEWRGKFYDSECVTGVSNPLELPFNKDKRQWDWRFGTRHLARLLTGKGAKV